MNSLSRLRWRARFADPRLHEVLWYCVPAVLAGLAIRVWLTAMLPYGQFHFDTPDFLQTANDLIRNHRLTLHAKKTFLTPVLYTLPFLLRLPALVIIPLGQHLLGMLTIVMAGLLCRLWLVYWQWFIVPLTMTIALHPAMLWFEHTLLAETHYLFGIFWTALAGSLFARRANWRRLWFLMAALLFTAAARPEGRLFLAFGFLLLLAVLWGRWRKEVRMLAAFAAFSVAVGLITKTGQAGVLLYASIIHLAPEQSRVAPGIAEDLRPLRERLRQERALRVTNDVVRAEKSLGSTIEETYAPKHPEMHLKHPQDINNLCLHLAIEAARNQPFQLPGIVFHRFLARINEDPGGHFLEHDLHTRQIRALKRGMDHVAALGPGLAGVPLESDDAITEFVNAHYDPERVRFFNRWEANWMTAIGHFHLPDVTYSAEMKLPGLPWFYVLALAGAIAALVVPSPCGLFHRAFLPVLAGVWFTVTLTGALVPRYRVLLEPFWLLYLFFLVDTLGRLTTHFFGNGRATDLTAASSPTPAPR